MRIWNRRHASKETKTTNIQLFAHFPALVSVIVVAALGWACAGDDGDDDSAGAKDAGTDADASTVNCPDSDSCDCTDFHDDLDECEDVGCLSWSIAEYDIDKAMESDEHCEDVDDVVKRTHDFCVDEFDQDHQDAPTWYRQYDEDESKWRVFSAPHRISVTNEEKLGLEQSCPPEDYPDAHEACRECLMF